MRRNTYLGRIERAGSLTDRTILDVRAARRGPAPLARRLTRRAITRSLFGALRKGGLW
jgi:hypothetical protein